MLEIAQPRPAIFLLDRNAVQAERADFRPQVAGELITLVDFLGTRRDLVAGKIVHRLAYRVCGFTEIEIEHRIRVGNHGRAASGNHAASAYSLILWLPACHWRKMLRRGFRQIPAAGVRR
jgi:hypothetical protein